MRNLFLCVCSLMLALTCLSSQSSINVGAPCPTVNITDWVHNVPEETGLDGKVVVIDFWATWCGPCIKAVPHYNDLVDHFQQTDEIIFLSMTDENTAKISRTLERIDFQSAVVTDQSGTTQEAFGIQEIPYTLVINKDLNLAWKGHPESLNSAILEKILNDELLSAEELASEEREDVNNYKIAEVPKNAGLKEIMSKFKSPDETADFKLIPTTQESGLQVSMLPKLYYKAGSDIISLAALSLATPPYRVSIPEELKGIRFNVAFLNKKADSKAASFQFILTRILDEYDLSVQKESRLTDCWRITVEDETKLKPSVSTNTSKSDAGEQTVYTAIGMEDLLFNLETKLEKPLINATGLEGNFDFIIKVNEADGMVESLNSYGLSVEPVKREMTFYRLVAR